MCHPPSLRGSPNAPGVGWGRASHPFPRAPGTSAPAWARPRRQGRWHSPSFSSLCRRRDMPHAGAVPNREAGREERQELSDRRPVRGQQGGARSVRRAGALARDGSRKRRQERCGVGLTGSGAREPVSGSSLGRGRPVYTQPPPRASSASRRLPSPAFRFKSFRGHAESTASLASLRPPAASQA